MLPQSPGGPFHPYICLSCLQHQNLEPGRKPECGPSLVKSLTSNVHPLLIKRIKYSLSCCSRNASHTSGTRGNKRIKAMSSSGRSRARALGSRCTWQEGEKKMLWLWQLLFSVCIMCSQGRAGDSSWSREW